MRGTALYVAAVAGPGLLTLPAVATATAGPAAVVAVAGLLLLSAGVAATFVALERHTGVQGGGVVQYTRLAFGTTAATVVRAWFVLGVPVGVPALGMIAGEYVAALTGGGRVTVLVTSIALSLAALVACLGPRGPVDVLNLPLTILLAAVVLMAVVLTAGRWDSSHLQPVAPHGWTAVLPAALVLAWILTGWEAAANFAGSLADRGRTLRRVTTGAVLIVGLLFLTLTLGQILALGPQPGPAPVAQLLELALGPVGALGAVVLAPVVALNNAAAYTYSLTLVAQPVTGSRHRSLAVVGTVIAVTLSLATVTTTPVETLVVVCAASQLPVYLTVLLAAVRLLSRHSPARWTAMACAAAVAGLLLSAGTALIVPAVIAVAAIAYARHSRHHPARPAAHPAPATPPLGADDNARTPRP
ncbi:amino acid permease [Isoptericola sp. NPDC019693]|uniref:amino acid permease n=1 Tax=Isoptericola sp. NPDC019693 TaxID=3364009 RepID=UPI003795F653